ncbi:hypothetical protein KIPB_014568, partial [Kipferlia bialata]
CELDLPHIYSLTVELCREGIDGDPEIISEQRSGTSGWSSRFPHFRVNRYAFTLPAPGIENAKDLAAAGIWV